MTDQHGPTTTTRLWAVDIRALFEADSQQDAQAVAEQLTKRVLEHPSVWTTSSEFDPDQTTETVDG